MDTIIIRDTVFQAMNNTMLTTSEMAEIYKEIINSQTETYNFIIYVFLGIIALFAGVTWVYNSKFLNSVIKKETKKIFNEEKDKIIKDIKSEYEGEINYLKAERCRLFAISIKGKGCQGSLKRYLWWILSVYYYQLAGKSEATRRFSESAIDSLEDAMKDMAEVKKYYHEIVNTNIPKPLIEIIESLPDELKPEKEKLTKMIAKIEASIAKANKID